VSTAKAAKRKEKLGNLNIEQKKFVFLIILERQLSGYNCQKTGIVL
jgi:hypothetical protein